MTHEPDAGKSLGVSQQVRRLPPTLEKPMTTNLHEMFGLPEKKIDYRTHLMAATEHMRSEVKDVFRELGLQEDDPCQRRLTDACNAWVQAATEMADAHTDHVERRVMQISDQATRKIRKEFEVAATEKWRDMNRALRRVGLSLVLAVALVSGAAGFVGGLYTAASVETVTAK